MAEGLLRDDGKQRQALERQLAHMRRSLAEHFAAEERTTAPDPKVHAPALIKRLRELDEEHQTLLVAFEEARGLAQQQDSSLEQLRDVVLSATQAFAEHEAKEDVIFREIDY
jgi:hemerythrin